MITHDIPYADVELDSPRVGRARMGADLRADAADAKPGQPAGLTGRHGSVRVALHVAARREGPGVDSGAVPRCARARWLRGPLLLSDARPAGARCRRQCAAGGDRGTDRALRALFGGARAVCRGALRYQRSVENRRRGEGDAHRAAEVPCGNRRRCRVRRPRPQVSDLGARPLPRGTRGGHREGPRAQEAAWLPGSGGGSARSTGMMTGSGSGSAVAGGLARHVPVLVRRVVEHLAVRVGGLYVDATFGAGGYTREILSAADCRVIGIDRDRSAIARGADLVEASGGRLTLVEDRFSHLASVMPSLGHDAIDGVVLDLGVSSMQLDEPERGFSFRLQGPLDMRMGGSGPSAADVVAGVCERDLAAIIATLGEERHARAVARAIVRARAEAPIVTTRALADIVSRVVHARPGAIHPATRTFQALRIFVNEELAELAAGLAAAERVLKPSGRLVVVAFHSLEDRIVKTFLNERSRSGGGSRHQPAIKGPAPTFRLLTRRPIAPDDAEIAANPRARSAKLRAAERTEAAPITTSPPMPSLPSLADVVEG